MGSTQACRLCCNKNELDTIQVRDINTEIANELNTSTSNDRQQRKRSSSKTDDLQTPLMDTAAYPQTAQPEEEEAEQETAVENQAEVEAQTTETSEVETQKQEEIDANFKALRELHSQEKEVNEQHVWEEMSRSRTESQAVRNVMQRYQSQGSNAESDLGFLKPLTNIEEQEATTQGNADGDDEDDAESSVDEDDMAIIAQKKTEFLKDIQRHEEQSAMQKELQLLQTDSNEAIATPGAAGDTAGESHGNDGQAGQPTADVDNESSQVTAEGDGNMLQVGDDADMEDHHLFRFRSASNWDENQVQQQKKEMEAALTDMVKTNYKTAVNVETN